MLNFHENLYRVVEGEIEKGVIEKGSGVSMSIIFNIFMTCPLIIDCRKTEGYRRYSLLEKTIWRRA
jgi:hypothetical protein